MEIIRETKPLLYSSNEIYDYVIKIDNYEAILGNEIRNFEKLTENQFKIKIGSMPNICLELVEDKVNCCVKLISNDSNLNFKILISINSIDEKFSAVNVKFDGTFSSMIEMMIKNPLEKFIDSLRNKIEDLKF
jgi:ribosome-associated toxin RatA of RatAB toxin-antitoxin module